MGQLFANAARANLASAISGTDTTLAVAAGQGGIFPVASTGSASVSPATDWFKLVLEDGAGIEIIYVRSHAAGADTMTNVLRGQDGTAARAWSAGAVAGLRMTAQDAQAFMPADKLNVSMSDTATSSTGWGKVPVNNVAYDTAGMWDAANKRAVPKRAGHYMVNLRVRTNTAGALVAGIGKNGSNVLGLGPDGGTSFFATGGSAMVYCNGSTDYIELWAYASSARTFTTGEFDTYLQLVGPL